MSARLLMVILPMILYGCVEKRAMIGHSRPAWIAGGVSRTEALFSGSDSRHGVELWRYDGVTATLVADINQGATGTEPKRSSSPQSITHVSSTGTEAYFTAYTPTRGRELAYYNGTTVDLKDIWPGPASSDPNELTMVGNRLFFSATDQVAGRELWVSDSQGTHRFDLHPGAKGSGPVRLTSFQNKLFFVATGKPTTVNAPVVPEVWSADGVAAPSPVPGIQSTGVSRPNNLVVWNGALWFTATDNRNGRELWMYPGSGTAVRVLVSRGGRSSPSQLTPGKNFLAFTALVPGKGRELHLVNTSNVTKVVSDFPRGQTIREITSQGDDFFFTVACHARGGSCDKAYGIELWRTKAGKAVPVEDIKPGPPSSKPRNLRGFAGGLLFNADDGKRGREPWIWKAATGKTSIIRDINTGPTPGQMALGSFPSAFTPLGTKFLFSADNGRDGLELWEFNGTDATMAANVDEEDPLPVAYMRVDESQIIFKIYGGKPGAPVMLMYGNHVSTPKAIPDVRGVFVLEDPIFTHAFGHKVNDNGFWTTLFPTLGNGASLHPHGFQFAVGPASPIELTPQFVCTGGAATMFDPAGIELVASVSPWEGCVDDRTRDFRINVERSGSSEVPAWVALVKHSAADPLLGTPESRILAPLEWGGPQMQPFNDKTLPTEFDGRLDFNVGFQEGDPPGNKLELWMFLEEPVDFDALGNPDPDNPPPGMKRVWWSYC